MSERMREVSAVVSIVLTVAVGAVGLCRPGMPPRQSREVASPVASPVVRSRDCP